jgi:nitrite reductase (NO-forming)
MRDLPTVFWLLATVVATMVHPWLPAPRWLMLHLLLLGALTHSVFVWSRFFAESVLRSPSSDTRVQDRRLVLLNGGVAVVVVGVAGAWWPVTVAGALAVVLAVVWHGWELLAMLRRSLPSRFAVTVRFYVAAACMLPVGATLGTILARGLGPSWHPRVELAHASVNLLGWLGLTVIGTLVTLWPTMLRTRMAEGAERLAAHALPVLVTSLAVIVGGALLGLRPVVVLGLLGYLAGFAMAARALLDAARRRRPSTFAPMSVGAGLLWLTGCLVALAVGVATSADWTEAEGVFAWLAPYLAAGFAAQVLLGALSYLVPVALGGGPRPVRAATAELDRGAPFRVVLANATMLLCVLPVPSVVRVIASLLALAALASFLPLLFRALRASRRAKQSSEEARVPPPDAARPAGQVTAMAALGVALAVFAVVGGVAIDPDSSGTGVVRAADAGATSTGETTTVTVVARDMRFHPSRIEVPVGNRLEIELVNSSDDVHDLVLEDGSRTSRVSPGRTTTLEVPVVGRDLEGWCSILGHRQMGMELDIVVTGDRGDSSVDDAAAAGSEPPGSAHGHHTATSEPGTGAAADLDFMAAPGDDFAARDAALPPLPPGNRVHRRTFTVSDVETEVAPGVTQTLWTYDGQAPGPTLHGRVGDTFVITLVNDGSVGHSVDFHASALSPQPSMRTIEPGEKLVYRFTAHRAGIWMYHCSTMPMAAHIANGLYGAVVIEPRDLPEVDRSYVLVQSELYLGEQGGEADADKLADEDPDAVVFNGYANQYAHDPLTARVGERVRIWVLDAGPNRPSSFHVIGGQFDTTWFEGAYLLRGGGDGGDGGSQALGMQAAQGGFVELAFPEAGDYPFVSHLMVDAERGAKGLVRVTD